MRLALTEFLRLHDAERDHPRKVEDEPERPPVEATVDLIRAKARLLDDAIDARLSLQITILDDGRWLTVPFLDDDPRMSVSLLPTVNNAVVLRKDGALSLVTKTRGVYRFDLELIKKATREEGIRRVDLGFPGPTSAVLNLQFDEDLLALINDDARRASDGFVLYPEKGAIVVRWKQRERAKRAPKTEKQLRPPSIESTIPNAYGSLVSTLEGRRIGRFLYELKFEGQKPITVTVPEGQVLSKVYLNGTGLPFEVVDGTLVLELTPTRAGDASGTLELVLERPDDGGYLLSGDFDVEAPSVSWPVNEMFLTLHLPPVFNYGCTGGSLSPTKAAPRSAFTHKLPLPGKRLVFHQYLIARSSPNLQLSYAIDLEGKYFR